ncbi:hypothetical protein [Ensifer sp. 22460]|uniref:hypothetical protein n=1 Tax=Ensifer sp. 22460 TaxID=3453922 RepID=UPI003F83CAAA
MTAGRQFRDSAARVLREIDRVRDESGTPENEPLHPDLASGKPWLIFCARSLRGRQRLIYQRWAGRADGADTGRGCVAAALDVTSS